MVVDGALAPRPILPVSLSAVEIVSGSAVPLVISGLPTDSRLIIRRGGWYVAEVTASGEYSFIPQQAGAYHIRVEAFPFLDETLRFRAT